MLVKALIAVFGIVIMLLNEIKTVGKIVKVSALLLVSIFTSSPCNRYKLLKWYVDTAQKIFVELVGRCYWSLGIM